MLYRITTDGARQPIDLRNTWAGPARTPCWIIGGGSSLRQLPVADIAASPAPKFAVNLAGHGLLRPTFWTSYDPTARFQRSIYLDASITKFVHRCRAMDLIPDSTHKVCDAPALYFFDRAPHRGYHDFLTMPAGAPLEHPPQRPAAPVDALGVPDWQDSLIQAIAIAFHLGFRTLYLAGCEMGITPQPEHLELAASIGVEYRPREPLGGFFDRCRQAGVSQATISRIPLTSQYHFDEAKSFAAAVQTDLHYFRVAQYLRLARRNLALSGLELVSVTPDSRLNDHFPYRPVEVAIAEILAMTGDPASERAAGRYTDSSPRRTTDIGPMRDFPPHNWRNKPAAAPIPSPPAAAPTRDANQRRIARALEELPEIAVPLNP